MYAALTGNELKMRTKEIFQNLLKTEQTVVVLNLKTHKMNVFKTFENFPWFLKNFNIMQSKA